ncbi:MAG TPA: DUF4234 domain-containing protein [Polyangiaceae bacterium]
MGQAPDPLTNPYAPPKAESSSGRSSKRSRYEDERRSVPLLIVLCVVTFGIYPAFWYVRRTPFFDRLDSDKRVDGLQWVVLVLTLALLAVAAAQAPLRVPEGALRAVQLAAGIANLVLAFRVARMLRSDFARTGRLIRISSVGVFFFGCLYLQHVINQAADTPAYKRKRKKKQPAEATPQPVEAAAPADGPEPGQGA